MKQILLLSLFATLPFSLHAEAAADSTWNQKSAAAYLDGRSEWWMSWPQSARDHGTFCISCHTAAPYAISRLALRGALGEQGLSPLETKLVDNVTKRVKMWSEVEPFYKDGKSGPTKSAESRGTESVLNALILATYKSPEAATAFDNMWKEQYRAGDAKGSFPWLDFKNRPWEADDSPYYGAALAAIAVGANGDYKKQSSIAQNVHELTAYLQTEFNKQSLANQLLTLWASAKLPAAITAEQKRTTIDRLWAAQQPDGGWSLTSLAGEWKRRDGTALETKSDGYGTGLAAFALQNAGVPRSQKDMKRALTWLVENQNPSEGSWVAYSLNKNRVLTSDVGRFMADAATGYAVLALTGIQ